MDESIPKIHPEESRHEETSSRVNEGQSDSLLLPKINLGSESSGSSAIRSVEKKTLKDFKKKGKRKKYLKTLSIILTSFLIVIIVLGFLFYIVYKKAITVQASVNNLIKAGQEQDLDKVKQELSDTKSSLAELQNTYKTISWIKFTPFVGVYVSDGEHAIKAGMYGLETADLVIAAVEPYADIIGFKSGAKQAESGQETTQDRIDFIIKTIPDLVPKADEITAKVKSARTEIDQIDPERYPEEISGKKIREKVKKVKDLVDTSGKFIENGKPLLEEAPYILGTNEGRHYLVIFQNDKELRPTGGFITAYTLAKVEKGKFEPGVSDDIYNLDNKYTPKVTAPDPIVKYLKGPYLISKKLRLRDMNWSPDFADSMELFTNEAGSVGIDDIDGVIAVDTQVLVYILDVIGPIGVPGFGEFSTKIVAECNCPQVIHELESFADIEGPIVWSENEPGKIVFAPPNYDNRKKIIGPLMNAILSNALGQPKEKLPPLFEAGFKSLTEKHVLFYLFDDKAQEAVEVFGIAGTINEYDADYLYINDANLGGRKSNLYVKEEINQEIEVDREGIVTKTVTLTYKNPEKHDGWLNSVLPNWVRVYVPAGAELISFGGVEEKVDAYEEFGKTVFAGFFKLRPQGVAKITLKYKLPFKFGKEYKMLIQKQPGKDAPLYSISSGKHQEEFFLKTDKELKFRIQ